MATRQDTNFIVIHCTATPPNMIVTKELVDSWHKARGWSQIGYHFLIRRNGFVEVGRHPDEVGAHCKGHNYESIGVALAGGIDASGKA